MTMQSDPNTPEDSPPDASPTCEGAPEALDLLDGGFTDEEIESMTRSLDPVVLSLLGLC